MEISSLVRPPSPKNFRFPNLDSVFFSESTTPLTAAPDNKKNQWYLISKTTASTISAMFLYTRIPYQKTSKFLKVLLWALLQHTHISLWFWPGLVRPIVYTVSLFSLCFECEHFIQIYWAKGLKLRSYIMLFNGLFLADFKLIRIKIYKFFYGFFHFKKRHISKKNKSEQVSNPLLTRMLKPILSPPFSLSPSLSISLKPLGNHLICNAVPP